MTIPEACQLVMEAATISTGNQICVFDMGKSVKIADLAKRMIELAGYEPGEEIKIEYTGQIGRASCRERVFRAV